MKNSSLMVLAIITFIACSGRVDPDVIPEDPTQKDSLIVDKPIDPDIYLSAIEIPDDYDWRRDTAFGAINCNLVLYKNSEAILTIPAGPDVEIGTDPDMHHLIRGHIYTECIKAHSTTVKKDGVDLYQYNSPEKIIDILEDGKDVFTFCRRPYGSGICWRVNGDILYENKFGTAVGGMYADLGHMCFSFLTSSPNGEDKLTLVVDGNEQAYSFPDWVKPIDIRIAGGETYILATDKDGRGGYFIHAGDEPIHMIGPSFMLSDAHIRYDGKTPIVAGRIRNRSSNFEYGFIWKDGQLQNIYSSDEISLYARKGDFAYVRNSRERLISSHSPEGEMSTGDDQYYFFTDKCACFYDNRLYVILTSTFRGQDPILWKGLDEVKMPLNGYFTGIDVVNPTN